MADWILDLTLDEPFTCSERPAESNEIRALDYIPGPTLRGALAGALVRDGRAVELLEAWFGMKGPRWSPAYPASQWEAVVPMPLSFRVLKNERPFRKYAVWNELLGEAPLTARDYTSAIGENPPGGEAPQWSGIKQHWLGLQGGRAVDTAGEPRDASMHVGLHYARQANREGVLYSRREIAAGSRFQAWVHDPHGVLAEIPDTVFLGKRRSAGNGAARVSARPGIPRWCNPPVSVDDIVVQLMSDAIVPHGEGGFCQGLSTNEWQRLLGAEVSSVDSYSSSRDVLGWSQSKGVPRAKARAVAGGSVFRVRRAESQDVAAWSAAWQRVAREGIGVRREEGFGWIAIDPRWLEELFIPHRQAPDEARRGAPLRWPGLEQESPAILENLALLARDKVSALDKLKGPKEVRALQALARATSLESLRGHKLAEHYTDGLNVCTTIAQARFYLEALTILSGEQ